MRFEAIRDATSQEPYKRAVPGREALGYRTGPPYRQSATEGKEHHRWPGIGPGRILEEVVAMSALRREFVGHVWVDHGGVAGLDPMYVDLSDGDSERLIETSVGAKLDCDDDNLPEGMDHVGVYVTTGLGDGRYPVCADVTELPGGGTRVARIVIDCPGTEAEAQSDDLRQTMVEI